MEEDKNDWLFLVVIIVICLGVFLTLQGCSLDTSGMLDSSPLGECQELVDCSIADGGFPDAPGNDSQAPEDSAAPDTTPPMDSAPVEDSGTIEDTSPPDAMVDPCDWEIVGECEACLGSPPDTCMCNTRCRLMPVDWVECPLTCDGGCWGVWVSVGPGLIDCQRPVSP